MSAAGVAQARRARRRAIARARGEQCAVLGVYSASSPAQGLPLDLLKGRRVLLSLDADEPGERACITLAQSLEGVAGELVRERPEGNAKDWGDVLAAALGKGRAA